MEIVSPSHFYLDNRQCQDFNVRLERVHAINVNRVADLDPTISCSMDFQDLNSKILDPIKVLKF